MHSKRKELINPVRVFFAIIIVVLIWFAPIAFPLQGKEAVEIKESNPLVYVFASSADACPFDCIKCTSWEVGVWPRGCLTWECDAGCESDPGGGENQPPTISHVLNCTQAGSNGWCMGNLSLDLSASDPQGSQVIISGDVNGTAFACPVGATTCSIPLPEGAGNANYRVDAATTGLSATGSATYLLDSSTPQLNGSVSGVVGTNGWYKSNVTLTVAASDAVSGIASTTVTVDSGSQTAYSAPIELTDSVHTVILTTTDNAGHVTQTTQTFNIDTITPVLNVSLSGSMGTNNWYISDVTVTPTASDSGSGLASLEVSVDGSAFTNYQSPITFSDGIHSYQFRATDNAGNITESGGTLNIDTTTPALNLTTTGTMGLNGWYRSSAQITALGTDATSGVAKIEVSTDGGAFLPYTTPVTVNDGQHSYQFKVTDNAGNVTQAAKAVKVDTVTPSLNLNLSGTRGQNDWYVSSTSVTPTAADATSGIATLEMTVDGGPWTTANSPLSLSDGLHTYQYRVMDNAGNVTETPVQNLKVDTIAPVIEMMDELKLGEYLYYDLEDPTVAGQENSGLAMCRAVIEDDDEKYKKIVWADGLAGDKARDSILWDGKFADGTQAGWGSYFITLKISDAAGNERMRTAIVKVGLLSFLEEIPAFTPPLSALLPAQTTQTDSAAVTEFGGTNSAATGEATSESMLEGGTNSGATGAESASIIAGGTTIIHHETEYVKSGFTQESQSTNTPITNSNILWGAAATAMLGATLADWQRKREEEEARKRAEAAAQAEKEGGNGKKTPGQKVYEKIMQQKRIVGALMAEKKEKAEQQAASQRAKDDYRAGEKAYDIAQAKAIQQQARDDYRAGERGYAVQQAEKSQVQAGLSAYYESRKKGEETASTPQSGLLSNLWNAGMSAVGSVLSPTNAGRGGELSVQDGDPEWYEFWKDGWNKEDAKEDFNSDWNDFWHKDDENNAPTPTPNVLPTQTQFSTVVFTPTFSISPTVTPTPSQSKIYNIDGPMTVDQIPPEFICTLPEWKNINGQDLRNLYYYRCKVGEELMIKLLTDPNGWWWQDNETRWDNGGDIIITKWERVKTNEDFWRLALAYGLDTEGTELRFYNTNGYGPLVEEAILNKFWHFDKGVRAQYGKPDASSGVFDPDDSSPLGTNGRLVALGSLQSLEMRNNVLLPPMDGGSTNMWEDSWNRYVDLFATEPALDWQPLPNAPYEIGNINQNHYYYKSENVEEGTGKFEVLYRSSPTPASVRAILLTFEQFAVYSQYPK